LIDEQDLSAYLASKSIQTFRANGVEVTAHCWWCGDKNKGKGKLYLNADSWLWQCKLCGEHGGRKRLLEHFGDEDALAHEGSDPGVRLRIYQEAVDLTHDMLLGSDDMLEYLFGRGLSEEMILSRRYGFVPQNFSLVASLPSREQFTRADLIRAGLMTVRGDDFFNQSITIPYVSHGSIVQIREKQMKQDGVYRTPGGQSAVLYARDDLHGASDVIITEGEFDRDILKQTLEGAFSAELRSTAVVGLAGVEAWPDGFLADLDSADRVFVGFDPDKVGQRVAKKLAAEIGARARIIQLPEPLPKCDWSNYLGHKDAKNPHGGHGWRDVHSLMIDADMAGKRMFSIGEAAMKWKRQQDETPGMKLGFPSLDAVIRPGLAPGQVMIPLAKTGSGKSVFLSNLAHNMAQYRTLYISLEMTTSEIFEHLRRIHRFWYPQADADQRELYYARLKIVDQNRIRSGGLQEYIDEYAEMVGEPPELVMIDYLQYFSRGFRGGSMYEKVSDATMETKAVAKDNGAGLIIPSQVNRGAEDGKPLTADDSRDSGVVEETGDYVLSLYRPDQMFNRNDASAQMPVQTGAVNIGLLKSRRGGKGRVFNLRMSLMSLAMVDLLDRKASIRVEQENTLYRQGVHYDDYRKQLDQHAGQDPLGTLLGSVGGGPS